MCDVETFKILLFIQQRKVQGWKLPGISSKYQFSLPCVGQSVLGKSYRPAILSNINIVTTSKYSLH